MAKYEIHPYCAAFPDLSDDEFDALRKDLKYNGQQEPCWTFGNSLIDGKNRLRALEANKQPVKFEKWQPVSSDPDKIDAEIRAFVISKNLRRRHLNESQRALVAAQLESLQHGGKRGENEQDANLHATREAIAEELNVSPRSVAAASKVIDSAVPEIVEAVESGEVRVSDAAKVAGLPKPEQRKALAAVESGKAPTLAKAAGKAPSVASVNRNGKKTIAGPPYDADAIEKQYGALVRSVDEVARKSNLTNSKEHKATVSAMSDSLKAFKVLRKICDAVHAKK